MSDNISITNNGKNHFLNSVEVEVDNCYSGSDVAQVLVHARPNQSILDHVIIDNKRQLK